MSDLLSNGGDTWFFFGFELVLGFEPWINVSFSNSCPEASEADTSYPLSPLIVSEYPFPFLGSPVFISSCCLLYNR